MVEMWAVRRIALATLVASTTLLGLAAHARADAGSCHVLTAELTPVDNLQIVAWLEDPAGNYVDTIYITQQVGRYGLGNRPGRFDFNSGPLWPYGRRVTTFPVWSHRHGMQFPEIEFQNGAHACCGSDGDLSHSSNLSSEEDHYCKPRIAHQEGWDTMTCASAEGRPSFTDKGVFSPTAQSVYPPRADLAANQQADSPSVAMYKMLDPFDAVSQATPTGGVATQISWHIPAGLPNGDYVLWVEVAKETDAGDSAGNNNATYNATTYPPPTTGDFSSYGVPYRGQPSVVYRAPISFGGAAQTSLATDYEGYGDPDGVAGTLNPPDATITTAAARLQLVSDGGDLYRLRVTATPQADLIPPGAATEATAVRTTATTATVSFVAPGDDGILGKATAYQIRYLALAPITDANFATATDVAGTVTPDDSGQVQLVDVTGLLPLTPYSLGIRAIDECGNVGPLAVTSFTTSDLSFGSVDACFVATAAYGSVMANDVELLRGFRDRVLQSSALGELAVETYYTFGPPMAQVVGSSELLRASARDALGPAVDLARTWRPR